MTLGKAFIEVHADTKPFARELASELDKIISASEKTIKVNARKIGSGVAEGVGEGIEKDKKKIGNRLTSTIESAVSGSGGAFAKLTKGLIDSIDDGFSGLPAELKIVLGAALVALAPFVAALAAAVVTGIVSGLTVGGLGIIGTLIAFQFEEVREAGADLVDNLREQFLSAASFMLSGFTYAIDEIQRRFTGLQAELVLVFASAGRVITPLVDSLIGLLEQFLPAFNRGLSNIDEFLLPLQVGFRLIGKAAGEFFEAILSHPEAPRALYDLLIFVEDLIQFFTSLVKVSLHFYGIIRDAFEFLGIVEPVGDDLEEFSKKFGIATDDARLFGKAIEGTIVPLESETEKIEEMNKAISDYTSLILASLDNQIAWEQGLDDLSESIKDNGRSLDITKQAGRDNAQALINLAEVALRTRADTIALTGEVDNAEIAFAKQRDQIYLVAKQMGLSKTRTEELVGALLRIPAPKSTGVTDSALSRLEEFNKQLRETIYLQSLIAPGYNPQGPGGQQKFADGGIVTAPTNALIGEAGAEAVIPLTNPARAAQLMSASGLDRLASPVVNVYIGNQQLNPYIDSRVDSRMVTTARNLNYGDRSI